ncbi:MAG: hypothetical protein LBI57_02380 [Helicobacteraceae bacterium]|nr:hypothetical protein [Helicobacteraceae bacterium]
MKGVAVAIGKIGVRRSGRRRYRRGSVFRRKTTAVFTGASPQTMWTKRFMRGTTRVCKAIENGEAGVDPPPIKKNFCYGGRRSTSTKRVVRN